MEERRNYRRVGYGNNIRFNIVEDGLLCDAIKKSVNVSGGGVQVMCDKELVPQQSIALEMHVPGYLKSIYAKGQVCWSGEKDAGSYVSGIRFTNISSFDRHMILDYVYFGE